ncbi:hypothetical protein JCM19000A_00730 [Silvimonas sp. JCM 19000]
MRRRRAFCERKWPLRHENMRKLILVIMVISTYTYAIPQRDDPDKIAAALSGVTLYGMSLSGFIAHELPGKIIYDRIMKNKNALAVFSAVMQDKNATPEAKAFALCGMQALHAPQFGQYLAKLKQSGDKISVMQGDVMLQMRASDFATVIINHGCF